MNIERELQTTDFSCFSKVKDSLKAKLYDIRAQKRELSWDELDNLAAAGGQNPSIPPKPVK